SVSVGPLFGELLAIEFAEWFEADATSVPGQNQSSQTGTREKLSGARDVPARTSHDAGGATKVFQDALTVVSAAGRDVPRSGSSYQLVEAGAHDGRLAFDILNWFADHRADLLA